MKPRIGRTRWMLAILPVVALLVALAPGAAIAATIRSGAEVNIASGKVIHGDLYVGGENVNMNGSVTGNLIAGGGNVNVNGPVGDSLLAAGGTMTVNDAVHGSVLVVGGTLDVTGRVDRDVTMLGGTLTVAKGAVVRGDVLAGAGTTKVQGRVMGSLKTSGGAVTLVPGAYIGGDLTYRGTNKPAIPSGVTIQGRVKHEAGTPLFGGTNFQIPWFNVPGWVIWLRTLVGLLALGLIFVWLAPNYSRRTVATMEARWPASLGMGLAVLILAPILAALIFGFGLLVGGWWLGLIAFFAYLIGIVLAATVAGLGAVDLVARRTGQPMPFWAEMAIGVVVLTLVGMVPYLGWAVCALGLLWALGALTMALFQRPREPTAMSPTMYTTIADGKKSEPPVTTPVG